MPRSVKSANPFYVLLLVAGIAFAATATVYGVMALNESRAGALTAGETQGATQAGHPLLLWMSVHGDRALTIELVLLALFTFGAIGTDEYWQRRAAAAKRNPPKT